MNIKKQSRGVLFLSFLSGCEWPASAMTSKVLRRPRALMVDLSGTIHIEDKAVEGAIEAGKSC